MKLLATLVTALMFLSSLTSSQTTCTQRCKGLNDSDSDSNGSSEVSITLT